MVTTEKAVQVLTMYDELFLDFRWVSRILSSPDLRLVLPARLR